MDASELHHMLQALSLEARVALDAALARGLEPLQVHAPMTCSEWAERNFYLSAESSYGEKDWKAYPFQTAILDAMGSDDIEQVDVIKSARVGYALDLDTAIPTSTGWTTMRDIAPGVRVFDERGQPCTVQYVSPVYVDHDCFEVEFCDGTKVVADRGHRWFVEADQSFEYLRGELGTGCIGRPKPGQSITKAGVVDTGDLEVMHRRAGGRTALAIPVAQALSLPDADLPAPPYMLGLWLGDGHKCSPRITQHRDDVETAEHIRREGVDVSVKFIDQRHPNNATLFLGSDGAWKKPSPWAAKFRLMGVLNDKHIPAAYLRASIEQRLQLLRGLMDSDGNVTGAKGGFAEFVNTNKRLADGVYELVMSLGMKATIRTRKPRNPVHLLQYRVTFKPTPEHNPFNLSRKASSVKPLDKPSISKRRRIVAVRPVPSVPVRCIEVDSPSSLFLCGRSMVPTHNTKMALATIGYMAEHKRRNQVLYQPTDDDRDEFVTTELEPMLRDVKAMRRVFPKFNRKSKDNTLKVKRFLGCLLHTRGGKAAKNYRRLTTDTVILDELSGFDPDVEKEGSPDKLAWKRTEGAAFRKMICGSTPKLRDQCLIEKRHAQAELRFQVHIQCPHCHEWHPLSWGGKDVKHGMRWVDNDPDTVRHVCPHNGCLISQQDYLEHWHTSRWVAQDGTVMLPGPRFVLPDGTERPAPRHIGVHVWTAYSPQASWADIVREFLAATEKAKAGDKSDLKTFVNTTLGETWEEEVERTEASTLARRAALDPHPYRQGQVPAGGLVLVAGVDVQADRWEIVVWAIGRGEEMWAVWYQVVHGNPADQREWDVKLAPLLSSTFQHRNGPWLAVRAAAIDTGGHFTHQAYVFTRNNPGRNWFAVKGDSKSGQPIKGRKSFVDVNDRGRTIKRGATLWAVGTDTAKDLLHGRFEVMTPGPGFVHFPTDMPPEFYSQLTSEARVPVRTARGDEFRWVKPNGARNEVLDCTVYALFCVQALDLHRYSDQMWRRLESAVEPDLFDTPAEPDENAVQLAPEPEQALNDTPPPAPRPAQAPAAQPSRIVYPSARPASGIASSEWSNGL
jgi:terminase, large subunit